MELTNEKIMAYVDGELSPEESAEVKSAIHSSGSATAQMEKFRKSRDLLIREYGSIKNEPVPDHLINTVLVNTEAVEENYIEKGAALRRSPDSGLSDSQEEKGFKKYFSSWPMYSMAASLMLGLILGIGVISITDESGLDGDSPYLIRNVDQNLQKLAVALAREISENPDNSRYDFEVGDEIVSLELRSNFINIAGESCKLMESNARTTLELKQKFIVSCRDSDNEWYTYQ